MATRKIKLFGTNSDATTEATVLFDGVQVFQGAVGVVSDSELCAWDFNNADDTTQSNHTLSIQVTSGSLSAGICRISCGNDNIASWDEFDGVGTSATTMGMTEIDGDYYYPGYGYPYNDGQAERINCLVDGAVPEFLTTKADDSDIIPSGTLPDSPTFNGWYFRTDNGSTFTCTVRVPKLLHAK